MRPRSNQTGGLRPSTNPGNSEGLPTKCRIRTSDTNNPFTLLNPEADHMELDPMQSGVQLEDEDLLDIPRQSSGFLSHLYHFRKRRLRKRTYDCQVEDKPIEILPKLPQLWVVLR